MNVSDLLSELDRVADGPKRASVLDELLERAGEEPLDAVQRNRVRAVLRENEREAPELSRAWAPGVGEAHVLLTGLVGPTVGRLRVIRSGPGHEVAGRLGPRATRQVHVALECLARLLADAGRGIPRLQQLGHAFAVRTPDGCDVEGASLGVAVAAALVSLWSGTAPRADVAATAAVTRDGTLEPVDGVAQKVRALRERYPEVCAVVVAEGQEPTEVDSLEGVTLRRRHGLAAALEELGVDPSRVSSAAVPTSEVRQILAALPHAHAPSYARDRWRRHAVTARLCAAHPRLRPHERTRARAWAALFHLHAGDKPDAEALASRLDERDLAELDDLDRVWIRMILATAAIDAGRDAEALARRALEDAEALRGAARMKLLGRAHGTLGRALVHAGRAERALPHLRAGLEHHRAEDELEVPRSANYLAMGLRRAGRHEEALGVVREALQAIEATPNEAESFTSRLYALYERARITYERGRFDEARADLLEVRRAQAEHPQAYPALGCLRYLAGIDLRQGRDEARDWLDRACAIAEAATPGPIREVAAAAAGEALYCGVDLPPDLEPRLRAVWTRVMGEAAGREALDAIIY